MNGQVVLTITYRQWKWSGPDMYHSTSKAFLFSSEEAAKKFVDDIPAEGLKAIESIALFTDVDDRLAV